MFKQLNCTNILLNQLDILQNIKYAMLVYSLFKSEKQLLEMLNDCQEDVSLYMLLLW